MCSELKTWFITSTDYFLRLFRIVKHPSRLMFGSNVQVYMNVILDCYWNGL